MLLPTTNFKKLFCFILFAASIAQYGHSQIKTEEVFTLPVLTNSQMSSVTTPNKGSLIYNSTDNQVYKYDGTKWVALTAGSGSYKIIYGNVNSNGTIAQGTGFTINRPGGTGRYRITFSSGFFSTIPSITLTAGEPTAYDNPSNPNVGGYNDNIVSVIKLTASEVIIQVFDNNGSAYAPQDAWFSFIAIGM